MSVVKVKYYENKDKNVIAIIETKQTITDSKH